MPGKVNPTQCESAAMICLSIMGGHQSISHACANGHLELNTYKPLILHTLYHSLIRLSDSINHFTQHCLAGLKVNDKNCQSAIQESLMLITALRPHIGYDECAKIATYADKNQLTLKAAVLDLKIMSSEEFDEITDPNNMV